ncbi:MAG TPA: hypothetical protein VN030_16010 [Cellvibrio sp.]|nr:hypothetical protein [Cellvibrio sp.]
MYQLNNRNWPIVIFDFQGPQTLAEHEKNLADWDKQFLFAKPFVAVRIFHDEYALMHPEGAGQVTKIWLRDGAAQSIKKSVLAMINIVPESAYERMKHMSVEAVFGVPGGIFKSYHDAVKWFNSNIDTAIAMNMDPLGLN